MLNIWRFKFPKFVIYMSAFALFFNSVFPSALFNLRINGQSVMGVDEAAAGEPQNMCSVAVDAVIVMDVSGSMADGAAPSQCEWWNIELVGPTYQWVNHIDYNVSEAWCETKDKLDPRGSMFSAAQESKIDSAKSAAISFVDNLGAADQSAVVSFNTNALLNKVLSADHNLTKTVINGLTAAGSTNVGDAIAFAAAAIDGNGNAQANKTIILLTDGKANKPYGPGHHEWPADVQYALDKAAEAAAHNYKIFTIGLGSDGEINESMLQDIAAMSGATYHHAQNGDNLSDIYNQISQEVCKYGSISGCKWNDINADGAWQETELARVPNWTITLLKDEEAVDTQMTADDEAQDQYGCYQFSGLVPGTYEVREESQTGWVQTYPGTGSHSGIEVAWDSHIEMMHFGNFNLESCEPLDTAGECSGDGLREHSYTYAYAICGADYIDEVEDSACSQAVCTSSISGTKYNGNENPVEPLADWGIELYDGQNNLLTTTTTDINGEYIFDDLCPATYIVKEVEQIDWEQSSPHDSEGNPINWTETITGNDTQLENRDFINLPLVIPIGTPICGDGVVNQDWEQCDSFILGENPTCSADCQWIIQPGDIIINEIMQDPTKVSDTKGEWLEFYNTSAGDIDLNGCSLGDLGGNYHLINSSLLVPAHGYAVLGINGDTALNGGIDPDYVYSSFTLGNVDDEVILTCNNIEIDRVEYTGSDPWPDPTGASMILSSPSVDNNDGSNWCVSTSSYGAGDLGTPGAPNDPCGGGGSGGGGGEPVCNYTTWQNGICVSDGQREQSRTDNSGFETCAELTQTVSDETCGCVETAVSGECVDEAHRENTYTYNYNYCVPEEGPVLVEEDSSCAGPFPMPSSQGDIVINEIMQHPAAVPYYNGEWLEVYNTTKNSLDLSGCTLKDNDNDEHTIGSSVVVGPGQYAVLANNNAKIMNGGVDIDYQYNKEEFGLADNDDEIILTCNQIEIDRVEYTGAAPWPNSTSASMSLAKTSLDNNVGGYWCESSSAWSGSAGDFGTPGAANDPCPGGRIEIYKYADLDGQSGTAGDQSLVTSTAWVFKIENSQAVLTAATSTDGLAVFENLELGNYSAAEEEQAGWYYIGRSPEQSFYPVYTASTTRIDFFNYYQGYCGDNIKNNDEQCDGSDGAVSGYACSEECVLVQNEAPIEAAASGGGFRLDPRVDLEADYSQALTAGAAVFEALTLKNSGNIVLTNGILSGEVGEIRGDESRLENEVAAETPVANRSSGGLWFWLAIILLHLWTIGAYSLLVRKGGAEETAPEAEAGGRPGPVGGAGESRAWWWALLAASLIIVYFLLVTLRAYPWLALIIVLLGYYLALGAHSYLDDERRKRLWAFVPLLLAAGPVAVYVYCGAWTGWIWLAVIVLYVMSGAFYYASLDKSVMSKTWWWFALLATLLVVFLEGVISWCG